MNRGDIKQAHDRAVAHDCEDVADMIDKLATALVAAEAREAKLREALVLLREQCSTLPFVTSVVDDALAQPADNNTALRELVAKAGEVMRERCICSIRGYMHWVKTTDQIRALPGVTLEDLQK